MPFVRIVAEHKDGGHLNKAHKAVLLCNIDSDHRILDGEWFGYLSNDSIKSPFILRNRGMEFFYGGDEHSAEPTNIGNRNIVKGEYFAISNSPLESEIFEAIYEITSIHLY